MSITENLDPVSTPGEPAARRDDARTFVSMALLARAGFLGLHALVTPAILLDHSTAGFSVAARVGLLLAACFAAISVLDTDTRVVRVLARHHRRVRAALGLVLVAFVLLAEAMIAVAFARTWHAMWWEWHVLMAIAFGAIVVAARMEYRREGSLTAVFGGIYLDSTLQRIDRHDADRLAEVVDTIRSGGPVDPVLGRFRDQGMSREEAAVLERQPERARLGGEERKVSVLKGKREPVPMYRLMSVTS